MNDECLLTAKELAALFRTSTAHIYNLISQGAEGVDIPQSIRIGRKRLWVQSEVLNWLHDQARINRQNTPFAVPAPNTPKIKKI